MSAYVDTPASQIWRAFNESDFLELPEGKKISLAANAMKDLSLRPDKEVVMDYGYAGHEKNVQRVSERIGYIQRWITRSICMLDAQPMADLDEFVSLEQQRPNWGWYVEIRNSSGQTHYAHLAAQRSGVWVLSDNSDVALEDFPEWRYCSYDI